VNLPPVYVQSRNVHHASDRAVLNGLDDHRVSDSTLWPHCDTVHLLDELFCVYASHRLIGFHASSTGSQSPLCSVRTRIPACRRLSVPGPGLHVQSRIQTRCDSVKSANGSLFGYLYVAVKINEVCVSHDHEAVRISLPWLFEDKNTDSPGGCCVSDDTL